MSTTPDLSAALWAKSSYSNGGGGNCIEWAPTSTASTGAVPVRDSKNPDGPALLFPAESWQAFVTAAADGEFGTV